MAFLIKSISKGPNCHKPFKDISLFGMSLFFWKKEVY